MLILQQVRKMAFFLKTEKPLYRDENRQAVFRTRHKIGCLWKWKKGDELGGIYKTSKPDAGS